MTDMTSMTGFKKIKKQNELKSDIFQQKILTYLF